MPSTRPPDAHPCPNADDRDCAGRLVRCGRTVLIFLWNKLDRRFDGQDKRIDDLRDDVKELRTKVEDLPLKIVEMLSKAPR